MNAKEIKAIETMKHWITYEKENKDKINKADELIEIQETIIKLIQKQQDKIDILHATLAENVTRTVCADIKQSEKHKEDLEMLYKGCQIENEQLKKTMYKMASFLASQDIECDICEHTGRLGECDSMAYGECEKMGHEGCYYNNDKNKEKKDMRKFEFVKKYNETKKLVNEDSSICEWKLPKRSTAKSAGYDFFAQEDITIPPYKLGDKPVLVPTGIKCKMQDDEYLMLVNRSSNPKKKNLVIPNSMGIIDADYYGNPDNDGEMMFAFYNLGTEPVTIEKGYALGQGIFCKYLVTDDDNAEGERVGGFGSTNK